MADSATPQRRPSRYRSQRKAQDLALENENAIAQPSRRDDAAIDDQNLAHSKSRYRRRQNSNELLATRPATQGDQDQIDVVRRSNTSNPNSPRQPRFSGPPVQRKPSASRYRERPLSPPIQEGATDPQARRVHSGEMNWSEEEGRRKRLTDRYSIPASPVTPSTAQPQSATRERFAPEAAAVRPPPNAVRHDGPPTSEQIRATKSLSALPKYADEDSEEEAAGCLGLFKRKRVETEPQLEKAQIKSTTSSREPPTIKAGGGGIVPGIDAPISAVNAGDRRVVVEYGKAKMQFPVTPATTPVDIINGAVARMSGIDVNSAVLLEYFGTVGVQRPLRRYEHVRDVMNSWDTDSQNILRLVHETRPDNSLRISGVPSQQPGDETWLFSVSQKVGKWDKRLITLQSNGQITQQKKNADVSTNLCHLSDFDIYTPTQEKVRRKIKPPKRHCFAVKSQQKTAMFESTEDFVQFFCTGDKRIADAFYAAVQGWRSWYLVNVMGEGAKPSTSDGMKPDRDAGLLARSRMEKEATLARARSQRQGAVTDAGFTKSSNQFDTTLSPERRARTTSKKTIQRPPGAMSNRAQLADDEPLVNLARKTSTKRRSSMDGKRMSEEEFAAAGLLGRKYSQRQREFAEREREDSSQRQRELENAPVDSPFTSGHNLLNTSSQDSAPRRANSNTRPKTSRANSNENNLQRSGSRAKAPGKPLVDLTPQYREPPQHAKKGKPFLIDPSMANTNGPLIDNATSPADPFEIPATTEWRGGRHHAQAFERSATMSKSQRRPQTAREIVPASSAFTGEGLLAAQQDGGSGGQGRGVMDGSRAKGPMLDLNEESMFVQGSLLKKVEAQGGPRVGPIDRSHGDD